MKRLLVEKESVKETGHYTLGSGNPSGGIQQPNKHKHDQSPILAPDTHWTETQYGNVLICSTMCLIFSYVLSNRYAEDMLGHNGDKLKTCQAIIKKVRQGQIAMNTWLLNTLFSYCCLHIFIRLILFCILTNQLK